MNDLSDKQYSIRDGRIVVSGTKTFSGYDGNQPTTEIGYYEYEIALDGQGRGLSMVERRTRSGTTRVETEIFVYDANVQFPNGFSREDFAGE